MVLKVKVIIFCILLHYKIGLCLKYPVIDTINQLYTVTTDQKHTDRETSIYVENTKTELSLMKNIEFALHEHVCKTRLEMKEFICEELLQVQANGFALRRSEALKCRKKSYHILLPTLLKATESNLSVFTCPQVFYTDLETDEEKSLPYSYKISSGSTFDSAILFIQKYPEKSDIYPQKYVRNINFKKIVKSYAEYKRMLLEEVKLEKIEISRENIIEAYLQQKRTNLPYQKFQQFFSSLNICGLRRAHKIYLCKQGMKGALSNFIIKFDFLGYDDSSCRKYTVRLLEVNKAIENNPHPKSELYMIRCPPIATENLLRTTKSIHLFYVASNLSHHSITLFVRDNDKKETPSQELNISQLQMQPIFEHIRRERFLPEPLKITEKNIQHQKSYQEIIDEINSYNREVRTPSALTRSNKPDFIKLKSDINNLLQFNRDRWLSDHVSVSFSKVKNAKLIYRRFMITHKSIDVCYLSIYLRTLLCDTVIKRLHHFKVPHAASSPLKCFRKKVTLTAMEADDYETNHFTMWACRGDIKDDNLYFVGTS